MELKKYVSGFHGVSVGSRRMSPLGRTNALLLNCRRGSTQRSDMKKLSAKVSSALLTPYNKSMR